MTLNLEKGFSSGKDSREQDGVKVWQPNAARTPQIADSKNKTAPEVTCTTSGAGRETAGKPSVLFVNCERIT